VGPVNGFAKFARDLALAAAGIDEKANKVAEKVGRGAAAAAQANAPADTGALRAGVRFRRRGSVATVESSLYYSAFQEFGTSKMAPNPFMGPAVDVWAPRLLHEVEKIRDEAVRDIG
jgi:HK97 gp10 family phage protein